MICYQDKTFCTFSSICKSGLGCDRVLTKQVREDAEKWWGKPDAPVCVFTEFPECFIRFFEGD